MARRRKDLDGINGNSINDSWHKDRQVLLMGRELVVEGGNGSSHIPTAAPPAELH